jgi:hypothetical protein
VPKGSGPEDGVRSLRLARFGALRASLPRSEQQGVGASNPPPLARLGDEHTCPFRPQMAKVELEGSFSEVPQNQPARLKAR